MHGGLAAASRALAATEHLHVCVGLLPTAVKTLRPSPWSSRRSPPSTPGDSTPRSGTGTRTTCAASTPGRQTASSSCARSSRPRVTLCEASGSTRRIVGAVARRAARPAAAGPAADHWAPRRQGPRRRRRLGRRRCFPSASRRKRSSGWSPGSPPAPRSYSSRGCASTRTASAPGRASCPWWRHGATGGTTGARPASRPVGNRAAAGHRRGAGDHRRDSRRCAESIARLGEAGATAVVLIPTSAQPDAEIAAVGRSVLPLLAAGGPRCQRTNAAR